MNFFRLRVINTLFIFLLGLMSGYLVKETVARREQASGLPRYTPSYQAEQRPAGAPGAATVPETDQYAGAAAQEPPEIQTVTSPAGDDNETYALPVRERGLPAVAERREEPAAEPEKKSSRTDSRSDDAFFKNAALYAGRELEMDLQMILAKRAQGGWRLNFARTAEDKTIEYLYVDDGELLGEKPDLKIGYFYRVKFSCRKGDTTSGNTLLNILPTGEKASWATGMTAVE